MVLYLFVTVGIYASFVAFNHIVDTKICLIKDVLEQCIFKLYCIYHWYIENPVPSVYSICSQNVSYK